MALKRHPHLKNKLAYLRSDKRNQSEGLVFDPRSAPMEIVYQGEYKYWNTWRGFAVKPVKGDCAPEMQYLRDTLASGSEEVFNFINKFFMHMYQKPWEKSEVALVLLGPKGVGKSFLMESIISPLIDGYDITKQRHYYKEANPEGIFGKFTSQLDSILALFLDELTWGGDRMHRGILQDLITSPRFAVEQKNFPRYTIANLMRVIIASDSEWAVPASKDERRYAISYVSNIHQQDTAYYGGLDDHLGRGGGLAALAWEWANGDLAGFNCRAAPQTAALLDQKIETMPDIEKWFHYVVVVTGQLLIVKSESQPLDENGNPLRLDQNGNPLDAQGHIIEWKNVQFFGEICVLNKNMYNSYLRYMKRVNTRAKLVSESKFGILLREFLPKIENNKPVMNEDGRRVVSVIVEKRLGRNGPHCRILPQLSVVRDLWDFRLRGKVERSEGSKYWEVEEFKERDNSDLIF
jgi:hypothetical protein